MFESGFADRFSRTHWSTVPLVYVPVSLWLLWAAAEAGVGIASGVGLFAAGWLMWTLMEYLLHRFFFHWKPEGAIGERMHFIFHGVHHKWPRDPYRLVMPPVVSVPLAFVFFGLWTTFLPMESAALVFHAGFLIGYLWYDLGHYMMHHGGARWDWFKKLRKHHLVHHAPNFSDDAKFGVSTTLWDHVFRTYTIRRLAKDEVHSR